LRFWGPIFVTKLMIEMTSLSSFLGMLIQLSSQVTTLVAIDSLSGNMIEVSEICIYNQTNDRNDFTCFLVMLSVKAYIGESLDRI